MSVHMRSLAILVFCAAALAACDDDNAPPTGLVPGDQYDTGAPGNGTADGGKPAPTEPGPIDPAQPNPEPPGSEPTDPAPMEPEPSEPEPPTGIDTLGPLPPAMAGLRWPEQPRTTREVTVRSAAELTREASVAGTRILVRGAVGGNANVSANDIEIIADEATSLGRLSVGRGLSRVRIEGGRYTAIFISQPAQYWPSVEYRDEWMVSDVTIEGVHVVAPDMAFEIRGRRIAILRSRADAVRYSVWCGDTGPFSSEDIILHENVFVSAGPEATVRLVEVQRSATIANTLSNTSKHNYRIHGTSDLNYAAGNLLVGTGVMLGRMPGDDLGRVWFDDNVFHHTAPDLFNPDTGIDALHATGNVAYTNVWSCFYCPAPQPGWTLERNEIRPYTPPPSF